MDSSRPSVLIGASSAPRARRCGRVGGVGEHIRAARRASKRMTSTVADAGNAPLPPPSGVTCIAAGTCRTRLTYAVVNQPTLKPFLEDAKRRRQFVQFRHAVGARPLEAITATKSC